MTGIWKASIQPDDHNDRNGGGNERREGEIGEERSGGIRRFSKEKQELRRQNGPFYDTRPVPSTELVNPQIKSFR